MKKTAIILGAMTATPALAHPGHGAEGLSHWYGDVAHLGVIALTAIAVAQAAPYVARRLRERKEARNE